MNKMIAVTLIAGLLPVLVISDHAARAELVPYCEPMQSRDPDPEPGGFKTGLCPDSLERTPSWKSPATTAPPLSMTDAIRIADHSVRVMNPEIEDWELLEVGLHSTRVENKWYYTVRWQPRNWRTQNDQKSRTVGVLMDGRVL